MGALKHLSSKWKSSGAPRQCESNQTEPLSYHYIARALMALAWGCGLSAIILLGEAFHANYKKSKRQRLMDMHTKQSHLNSDVALVVYK